MVRLGLESNRCRFIGVSNDTMFICSTAYLVQSRCGRLLLLAYRGTEPLNFINWLTDADVNPVALRVPDAAAADRGEPLLLHGGFYRNQRATWFDVEQGLRLALEGRSILGDGSAESIRPVEALYITGHSLGAAMAAIAAIRIFRDPAFARVRPVLRAVYTYGHPMVANPSLAAECEEHDFLGARVFRHIYKDDVVPVLPPKLTGDFEHFGPELRSRGESGWRVRTSGGRAKQLSHLTGPALIAASAFAVNQVPSLRRMAELAHSVPMLERAGLGYSLYDHGTAHYIQCSQPTSVISEFGDF